MVELVETDRSAVERLDKLDDRVLDDRVLDDPSLDDRVLGHRDSLWVTIVWNDPVNLMTYVSYVFRSYFGYAAPEAERLMLLVHTEGRAVVAAGGREQMERHVEAMHDFGLWATLSREDA